MHGQLVEHEVVLRLTIKPASRHLTAHTNPLTHPHNAIPSRTSKKMVDIAAIIIAIISLVGTLAAAALTTWYTFSTEERKRRSEAEKLVRKYRDPLVVAAQELQSRLFNLVKPGGGSILPWMWRDAKRKENLVQYTCFLVGQYLAWTYILQRQAQFLPLAKDVENIRLRHTLHTVQHAFNATHAKGDLARPFILWRGQQIAIAEIMTTKEDGELYSIGFAAFRQRWREEETFREWFEGLVEGLTTMAGEQRQGNVVPDNRLRQLQHLLLQLTEILDPHGLRRNPSLANRCQRAVVCPCAWCETH